MPVYRLGERQLKAEGSYWIAENATATGSVALGEGASIWWNAVLRGDNDWIRVGAQQYPGRKCPPHRFGYAPDHRRGCHRGPHGDASWLHHWRWQPDRHRCREKRREDWQELHHWSQGPDPRRQGDSR